ncbi:MAG: orotate phosphoribosyltransferase [bacterium]
MSIKDYEKRLLELIKNHALMIGKFILSSGKESNYYLDERMVTLSGEGAYLTAKIILDMLKNIEFDAIGGMTLAADPIIGAVIAISYANGKPVNGFIVRKEPKGHGTGKQIEGPISKGLKVVIVDGTMTTGASIIKSIEAVENEGCKVVKVITLIDRQEGGREALKNKGYDFDTIFTKDDLLS